MGICKGCWNFSGFNDTCKIGIATTEEITTGSGVTSCDGLDKIEDVTELN